MTVLGIDASDRDAVIGWEAITPTRRCPYPKPAQILIEQAAIAWQKQLELADRLEDGEDVREELLRATLVAEELSSRARALQKEYACPSAKFGTA